MKKLHLAIHLPNWLGDVIMTLPSLAALTTAGIRFDLLGKPWLKDLFAAYPYPCHTYPPTWKDARRLYQMIGVNHALLFPNGLSKVLPLIGSSIQTTGYYRSQFRRLLLTKAKSKPTGFHEIEYFWQLTQFAVNQPLLIPTNPQLLIAEQWVDQAKKMLAHHQIVDGFILICPGAVGHGHHNKSKIWPYWQDLCLRLSQQGLPLVTCPAPFETQQFTEAFGQYAHVLSDINLPLYAALMQQATQVIANDSGPMHLAAAVQAPVLGVFGQSDPQRTRPWGGDFIGGLGHWPSCDDVLGRIMQ